MKLSMIIVFVLSIWFAATQSTGAAEPNNAAESSPEKVVLRWLGTAGWEIETRNIVILIDPFLTRRQPTGSEWKTDEEAVLKVVRGAHFIFAGHSHADHVADIPFIAKRFGAKLVGSRTTTNLALTAGVDKSQMITISGGEKLDFKEFSVQVIESRHGWRRGKPPRNENQEISRPWQGPIRGTDFVDGGSYLYYFNFGNHRVLHQGTGNFIEEKLKGFSPDVALLYPAYPRNVADLLKTLNPRAIILHHFDRHYDEQRAPFSDGIPDANTKRAARFARNLGALDRRIKVITPQLLMSYTLDELIGDITHRK